MSDLIKEIRYLQLRGPWPKELQKAGKTDFLTDHYYIAGYDSPFRILNRHNEVWFVRTTPRDAPTN